MERYLCRTCGTQFAPSDSAPAACPICQDERQYIAPGGQSWTTLAELHSGGYRNIFEELEPGLISIRTEPSFAIGQRALLLQTPNGNLLWDCIAYLDDATIEQIKALGGIAAIAISHPHYYTTSRDWAEAFGAPLYLHAADQEWLMEGGAHVVHWEGERLEPLPGLTLLNLGGHFPGSTVLHFGDLLLTGDTIQVVPDRNWVSFMYSYPNQIPLPGYEVARMVRALDGFAFDRLYGFAPGRNVTSDAANVIRRSRDRYLVALQRPLHKKS